MYAVTQTPPAKNRDVNLLILRGAGIATLVAGVIGTVIGWLVAGSQGLIAGLIATAIVIVFFSVGQVFLGRVLATNPQMAMTVALTLYLAKIGALFILIILFADTTLFNTKVFAMVIVACTIVWTIAEVWTFSKTKVLYVEPGSGPSNMGPLA